MGMAWDNAPFNCDTKMQDEFLKLKNQYKIKNVIETGTYHGVTTRWLAGNFDKIFTVEVNDTYYKQAILNLSGIKNIMAYLGSSETFLPIILKIVDNDTIIFLDAHWNKNPLLGELKAIKESGLKPALIIHDFFVDGKSDINNPAGAWGFDLYPEQNVLYNWDFVKDAVEAIYGADGYVRYFNSEVAENSAQRGCLFVLPRTSL